MQQEEIKGYIDCKEEEPKEEEASQEEATSKEIEEDNSEEIIPTISCHQNFIRKEN